MKLTIRFDENKLQDLERRSVLVKKFMDDNRNEGGSERDGDITTWQIDFLPSAALDEVLKEMEEEGIEIIREDD